MPRISCAIVAALALAASSWAMQLGKKTTTKQRASPVEPSHTQTLKKTHKAMYEDDLDFNTTAFFQYVRETPEPEFLVYNRVPKTGSTTLNNIFEDGALSCPRQLNTLELNETYWHDYEQHEDDLDALVRERFGNGEVAHGVISGHFKFPRKPKALPERWGTSRVEFINTVRSCAPRMRSYMLFSIFNSTAARQRRNTNVQNSYLELLFGKGGDHIQCFQDDECINKLLQSEHFSDIMVPSSTNAIENYLGGDHWKEEGYTSAQEAVRERVFAPQAAGVGGYIAVGLLEAEEDSLLIFQCLLPSFFRQGLDKLVAWHSNTQTFALKYEDLEKPYAKFEARLEDKCRGEDSLYNHIRAIHKLLATKVRADPSVCRKRPQDFDFCEDCPKWCTDHSQSWAVKLTWEECVPCRSNVEEQDYIRPAAGIADSR